MTQTVESLFYVAKEKDGTALRRLSVIAEEDKARVIEECHSAPFSGHAGRDNTLRKIKEGSYWPDYHCLQDFILDMPFPCTAGFFFGGGGGLSPHLHLRPL